MQDLYEALANERNQAFTIPQRPFLDLNDLNLYRRDSNESMRKILLQCLALYVFPF